MANKWIDVSLDKDEKLSTDAHGRIHVLVKRDWSKKYLYKKKDEKNPFDRGPFGPGGSYSLCHGVPPDFRYSEDPQPVHGLEVETWRIIPGIVDFWYNSGYIDPDDRKPGAATFFSATIAITLRRRLEPHPEIKERTFPNDRYWPINEKLTDHDEYRGWGFEDRIIGEFDFVKGDWLPPLGQGEFADVRVVHTCERGPVPPGKTLRSIDLSLIDIFKKERILPLGFTQMRCGDESTPSELLEGYLLSPSYMVTSWGDRDIKEQWRGLSRPHELYRYRMTFLGDGNGIQTIPVPADLTTCRFRAPYVAPDRGYRKVIEYAYGWGYTGADESVYPPTIRMSSATGAFLVPVPPRFFHVGSSAVFRIRSLNRDPLIYQPHDLGPTATSASITYRALLTRPHEGPIPPADQGTLVGYIEGYQNNIQKCYYLNPDQHSRRLEWGIK